MNVVEAKILEILKKVEDSGFEIAIVGGAVRDFLAGGDVKDWDLTTNAKPEEILKMFPKGFYNNRFGTVGVPMGDGVVEVTTYRSEARYSDSRHPDEVTWGKTLEEDLKRRDFTINAIALRKAGKGAVKIGGEKFEVIDPFGGQADIERKIVRAVGEAKDRLKEDPLRMIRAVRFATKLAFEIDVKTREAISKNAELICKISGERIRDELFRIVDCSDSDRGFFLLHELGLLAYIIPELDVCFSVEQVSPKRHHIFDVGTHCVMSMKNCPSQKTIVKFAALLHDIGKAKVAKVTDEGVRTFFNHEVIGAKQARNIAERLHLSADERDCVVNLVRWHQFSVGEVQTDSAVRRFINNVGLNNVEDMMNVRIGDRLGSGITEAESWRLKLFRKRIADVLTQPFSVKDLKINGADVMRLLKIKPGPKVGEILNKLFEEVVEDKEKNKQEYLEKRIKVFQD